MNELQIANRTIGLGERPYIIAEAGVHHNNDLDLAKKYIDAANTSGADAIKFQTYSADRLVTKKAHAYWDENSTTTQYEIFSERSLLTKADYAELATYAASIGIHFLSTPFDPDALEMLANLGMPAFKLASADITNTPLLEAAAATGKPILMSTGASTFAEIETALEVIGKKNVCLLHCNLAYPTPLQQANLGRIELLREKFPEIPIGYSDHTQPQDSELPCPLAVGLGAVVVEKHFTLDKTLPGDDHYHAVDVPGLTRLVQDCNLAQSMRNAATELTHSEEAARVNARRSIVYAKKLKPGDILTAENIDCKRPGTGLSPTHWHDVLGKKIRRHVQADDSVSLGDIL